jgi:hypothetical protein
MQDDRSTSDPDETIAAFGENVPGDNPVEEDVLDEYDDAVIAADATGMLASEKFITDAGIEQGLEGKDLLAGDV